MIFMIINDIHKNIGSVLNKHNYFFKVFRYLDEYQENLLSYTLNTILFIYEASRIS